MFLQPDDIVSAQVILRSESGRAFTGSTQITSENIHEFTPSARSVEAVSRAFEEAGFAVSSPVGVSFTITGTTELFETFFGVTLERHPTTGITISGGGNELPVGQLDESVRRHVVGVAFSLMPDFGPTNFF